MPRFHQRAFSGGSSESGAEVRPALIRATAKVRTVRAVEFIRPMRGASQPHLLRCDDGENYVVKFQNNPQHVRILANELLASRLAALIGLPVPAAAFVEVPGELVRPNLPGRDGSRGTVCAPGVHFGSLFPGSDRRFLVVDFLPDRLLRRVKELAAIFLGGFLLDKWTCSCDTRQVVFYRRADSEDAAYSAWLIDHGFCFNDGEWNFPDSPIRHLYPRHLVYQSVSGLSSFEPFLSRIRNLKLTELESCVNDIPAEWCGGELEGPHRLIERLYERRRGLAQAVIDVKNSPLRPFPDWR